MREKCGLAAALTATLTATLISTGAHAGPSSDDKGHRPDVSFTQCTEFVGLAPVPLAAARAMVPAAYSPVTDNVTATVVVRVSDCKGIRVGKQPARPGTIAHVGILIGSPDGTATDPNTSINNYTLSYASNSQALVNALRDAHVAAVYDADLAYEFAPATGPSELYVAVTPGTPSSPTWFLSGKVTNPGFATFFLANWWSAKGQHETKMATDFPVINFDFTSDVALHTSSTNLLGQLLGGTKVDHFPLSFRGAYDAATMHTTIGPARQ